LYGLVLIFLQKRFKKHCIIKEKGITFAAANGLFVGKKFIWFVG